MLVEEDEAVHIAGSAHRVDEAMMELFDYNDIQQVLGQIPGVVARGEDGFGLRPNIGIRGANSDRSAKITLLEDGLPLSPAPYAAPAAYYFPLSTRLVGVEVFKGPSSIKSGPQTIGGTLNVLTRTVPTSSEVQLELAGGLYGSLKGHGWLALGRSDRGILLEAVHLRSDGFKELDTGGPTGFERSDLMLKSFWVPLARNRLELKLGYGHEQSDETYLGLSVDDFDDNPLRRYATSSMGLMEWNRSQVELAWDSRWGKPSSSLTARTVLYHRWFHRKWHKLNGFRGSTELHKLLSTEDVGGAELS